ncbi:MAG: nuclear transport factor 2 family protein [Pseudomonadota bacterium]
MLDRPNRTETLQNAKSVVLAAYAAMDAAKPQDLTEALAAHHASDLLWRGFHPFNEITGSDRVATEFWAPLKTAMTGLQRRLDMFIAGANDIDGGATTWVASMGHLMGLFDRPWLGIRPTGKIAMLRYAAFHRVEGDRITETAMFFDIPHLMAQAGQDPFPPQTGAHLVQPGPMTHNGLLFDAHDPAEGQRTLDAINHMVNDIKGWTGGQSEPLVEELRRSWNEDMIWWGPHGIGATYTIERYAKQHSGPFREAFGQRTFNGHIAKIAEGAFGGFFGWPNLTLTHQGGFMGMPATGQDADMRVIDMYRRDGDKLTENWIFIDLLHFWHMQGLDVLGRMADLGPPD